MRHLLQSIGGMKTLVMASASLASIVGALKQGSQYSFRRRSVVGLNAASGSGVVGVGACGASPVGVAAAPASVLASSASMTRASH